MEAVAKTNGDKVIDRIHASYRDKDPKYIREVTIRILSLVEIGISLEFAKKLAEWSINSNTKIKDLLNEDATEMLLSEDKKIEKKTFEKRYAGISKLRGQILLASK